MVEKTCVWEKCLVAFELVLSIKLFINNTHCTKKILFKFCITLLLQKNHWLLEVFCLRYLYGLID